MVSKHESEHDFHNDIVELQTKLQFQEDTIQQLDQVIVRQNQYIMQLQQRVKVLEEKVDELIKNPGAHKNVEQEKPPHY